RGLCPLDPCELGSARPALVGGFAAEVLRQLVRKIKIYCTNFAFLPKTIEICIKILYNIFIIMSKSNL
ncbi:MAG: hypothetical protein K2J11_00665, partial [Oscillospiraceae bacterium]|nr:hypothetical protein [Oscillospiraceae bacterium]